MGDKCSVCDPPASAGKEPISAPLVDALPAQGPTLKESKAEAKASRDRSESSSPSKPRTGSSDAPTRKGSFSSAADEGDTISEKKGKRRKPPLEEKMDKRFHSEDELRAMFKSVDKDGNGEVDIKELSSLFQQMKIRYTARSIKSLLDLVDTSGNGTLDIQEFVTFFSKHSKESDLEHFVQKELDERQKANERPDGTIDVFIMHAMAQDIGERKSWWLANALENGGLTCAMPHLERALQPENRKRFGFSTPMATPGQEQLPMDDDLTSLSKAKLLCLLLDAESLVCSQDTRMLDEAADLNIPVCCFYEASPGYQEDLHNWKKACPLALAKTIPKPITRFFPNISAEICLNHVMKTLSRTTGASAAEPVEIEYDNFSDLGEIPGIRWLCSSVAVVMDRQPAVNKQSRRGSTCQVGEVASLDLPDTSFGKPHHVRPVYVSYPQFSLTPLGDLAAPGPTDFQFRALQRLLRGQATELEGGEGSMVYLDHISRLGALSISEEADVLLLSQIVVLDDLVDKAPISFIQQGRCFIEAAAGVLTGHILPVRVDQMDDLDKALGGEVSPGGESLSQIVRDNSKNPSAIIKRLCRVLASKNFRSDAERDDCIQLFEEMLRRNPLLLEHGATMNERSSIYGTSSSLRSSVHGGRGGP